LCWYLPLNIVVRDGQQIGVCTKKFDIFAPPSFNRTNVWGIACIDPRRKSWSSVTRKMKFFCEPAGTGTGVGGDGVDGVGGVGGNGAGVGALTTPPKSVDDAFLLSGRPGLKWQRSVPGQPKLHVKHFGGTHKEQQTWGPVAATARALGAWYLTWTGFLQEGGTISAAGSEDQRNDHRN
jgi:hypothetical protein